MHFGKPERSSVTKPWNCIVRPIHLSSSSAKTHNLFQPYLIVRAWLLGLMLGMPTISIAETYIDKSFRLIANKVGVKEELLRAICWQESRHTAHAYRENDGGKGNAAFGICQVLYTTAAYFGFKDPRCKKSFGDARPQDRKYANCKLFGPKTNMFFAAKFLKSRLEKYQGNQYKAVAAYNSGKYRKCTDGWLKIRGRRFKRCEIGGAINSYYIRNVYRALRLKPDRQKRRKKSRRFH